MFSHSSTNISESFNSSRIASPTDGFYDNEGNIVVNYNEDFNIELFDRFVMGILDMRKSFMADEICDLKSLPTDVDKEEYIQYCIDVISGKQLQEYVTSTKHIISMYKKHMKKNKRRKKKNNFVTYRDILIVKLAETYLSICTSYVDMTYHIEDMIEMKDYCEACGMVFNTNMQDRVDRWTCKCGSVNTIYRSSDSYKKTESEYDATVTFLKDVAHVQGKSRQFLPDGLYTKIDNYFNNIVGISREQVLAEPLNKDGTRGNTNLSMMLNAFKVCGFSAHYKRAVSVCADYWGWKLVDIGPYMEAVMMVFAKVVKAYKSIEDRNRKSMIPMQSMLCRILQIVGCEASPALFKLCTTEESKRECERLWNMTCEIANIVYIRGF